MGIFDLFKQIEGESHKMGKPTWLVVGLGNPGLEYAETRHNAGFLAITQLAKQHEIALSTMKFRSDCGDGMLGETRCFFMKPATYMNNSGEAVAAAAEFYKIPPERVLVLYDDISLPPGKPSLPQQNFIKFRQNGYWCCMMIFPCRRGKFGFAERAVLVDIMGLRASLPCWVRKNFQE